MTIEMIKANSKDGGDVYRLLNLVHVMAGRLANSPSKDFWLARTQSQPMYGPIVTVWTNGIVDVEARTYKDEEPHYHEYSMYACAKESDELASQNSAPYTKKCFPPIRHTRKQIR